MENTENTFITLGGLRRFLENLNVDMNNQMLYINQQDDNILQTARQYSDSQDAINLATARGYTNDQDNLTLSSAKNYTDSKVGSAINTASNDATTKNNAVQNNLNTHIANITDAHDMANRLQALKVAMQAYTDQGISKVVGGAPAMLDTLYELSNAINNNANFSVTMTDMIGQKLNSSEVVNTPAINKILRLDANAQFPASVIAQDMNNRFFTDAERTKLAGIATGANLYVHPANHPPSIITQDANNRFFTDVERAKLAEISDNANNYVHPTNHLPSIITQDANNRFVTDSQINIWNDKQNALLLATEVVDGIMSASDKLKLDYIENGANKTIIANNLTTTLVGTALDAAQGKILNDSKAPLNHASTVNTYGWGDSTNRGHVAVTSGNGLGITNGIIALSLASQSTNGAFSSADKLKLDGIANGATNYVHPDTHPASMITGILPLANGGTGVSSKQGIIQLLSNSGDKNSMDIGTLNTLIFEANGNNSGYLTLSEMKTKLQWSTAELQAALIALPNI